MNSTLWVRYSRFVVRYSSDARHRTEYAKLIAISIPRASTSLHQQQTIYRDWVDHHNNRLWKGR